MKEKNQYRQLILFVISAAFVLAQTAFYAYVWFKYYDQPHIVAPFYNRGNYAIIGLYALMCFLFYKLFGCFRVGYLRVYDTLFAFAAALVCINLVTYLQLCLICRWRFGQHMEPMLMLTGADGLLITVWVLFSRTVYLKISPPRDLLVVYGESSPDDLMRKLSSRPDKYHVQDTVSYDTDPELLKRKLAQCSAAVVTDIPIEHRNALLKYCFDRDIRCYCVPKVSDILITNAASIHLFDTSLLLFRNSGLSVGQRFAKRLFDIVAASAAIVLTAPVMALVALSVKLCDGGPVFYTQERLTRHGGRFRIYKFRSMRVEEHRGGYCLARKNDDRITPVGKFLRNAHLDELPQLFNILMGDMSLVGPRPECAGLAEEYGRMIPEFSCRLKVKAGLTGYAQVYGKYNTTPYDKLKLDLTYISNYSFWLDLKLIFMTVKILFQKENTEGIESWQTSAATREDLEGLRREE